METQSDTKRRFVERLRHAHRTEGVGLRDEYGQSVLSPATYRPAVAKPCNECPFRRTAAPGYLGAGEPQSFIQAIRAEQPLPCHQTLDYEDSQWRNQWQLQRIGNACAGALIFTANLCKKPRDPAFPRLPVDRDQVFGTAQEFVAYHEAAPVRSWQLGYRGKS